MRNLITDVPGIQVGNAQDEALWSGVTVVLPDQSAVAAVDVRGGGPGTRETDLLRPENTVDAVHAVVLSGGSAYGLDAASGTMDWLRANGRGFATADTIVPIVPAAVILDLANGGDKDWGLMPPYRQLGYEATDAAGSTFDLGNIGAGLGATTANLKGGLGSASTVLHNDAVVGALAIVNPVGQVTAADTPHFLAALFERDDEFGGQGSYLGPTPIKNQIKAGADPGGNTAICVVATDLALSVAQAKRVAMMAHDGIARAILPVHTPFDGDTVFCLATGTKAVTDPIGDMCAAGIAAADCIARAVARGVYHADTLGPHKGYQDRFGVK